MSGHRLGAMRAELARRPIVSAALYTVVAVLPLYFVTAQSVRLQDELGFGRVQLGLIVASFYLVSAVSSLTLGPFIDRLGITAGFRIGAGCSAAAGLAVAALADRWILLAAVLGLSGLANTFAQLASNKALASEVGGARQGFAFGIKQSAVPSAGLIAGLAVPWIGFDVSWRWSFVSAAVAAGVALVIAPEYGRMLGSTHRTRPRLRRALVPLAVGAFFAGGIGNSIVSFVVDAASGAGFSDGAGARLLAVGSIAAIVVRLGTGRFVDRHQRSGATELLTIMTLSMVGFLVLAGAADNRPLFIIGVVLAFAGAWGWPGVMYYLVARSSDLPAATSTGTVLSGAFLGAVVWPPVFGAAADVISYEAAFTMAAVIMLLALVSISFGRRSPVRAS